MSQSLFHSEICLGAALPWPHCRVSSSCEEPLASGAAELHEASAGCDWGLCCGVSPCPSAGWGQCLATPGPVWR